MGSICGSSFWFLFLLMWNLADSAEVSHGWVSVTHLRDLDYISKCQCEHLGKELLEKSSWFIHLFVFQINSVLGDLVYLFIFFFESQNYKERQRQRHTRRSFICWSTYQEAMMFKASPGPKPGASISLLVSHVVQGPKPLAIFCCPPGTLAGSWLGSRAPRTWTKASERHWLVWAASA